MLQEWEKWQLQAEVSIDQLRAELEDIYLSQIYKLAVGEGLDDENLSHNAIRNMSMLFIMELFSNKLKDGESLRCGISMDEFKEFVNNVSPEDWQNN